MNILFSLYFLLLGIIVGSFLNVVIYRYNTGRGITGRSFCFSCKRILAWYDLVPLFSFIFQAGKCRTCKSKISWQYPLVELLTGGLFLGVYMLQASLLDRLPAIFIFNSIYFLVQMSLLVLILVYDLRHKIIPNAFVYSFAGLAFLHMFFGLAARGHFGIVLPTFMQLAAGPVLAFPFYILWLISGGRWMGLGDGKLALGIGWFLGMSAGATAIIFGFWIGAVVSILILLMAEIVQSMHHAMVFGKKLKLPRLTMKSEVPFAPFLIIGLLIVFFFRYNIFAHLLFI